MILEEAYTFELQILLETLTMLQFNVHTLVIMA